MRQPTCFEPLVGEFAEIHPAEPEDDFGKIWERVGEFYRGVLSDWQLFSFRVRIAHAPLADLKVGVVGKGTEPGHLSTTHDWVGGSLDCPPSI